MLNKIRFYAQRIYRLSTGLKRQEEIVWKDLKKLHANAQWKHGIYESDRTIETVFSLSDEKAEIFYYMVFDGCYHCRVKILDHFDPELTTDLFILASHFNNILNNGVVKINVDSQYIEYCHKRDLLIPLLFSGELHEQLIRHFNTSKDIYAAFQRLVVEQEAPAIIIADLLNENRKKDEESE